MSEPWTPTPPPRPHPVSPAPRPDSLRDRTVLLFDNTKLAFASYSAIYEELSEAFQKGGVRTVRFRQSIRGGGGSALPALADRLVSLGADAAVLAFADVGVTPATVLLASELERRGLPTVLLTGDPGHPLAEAVAAYRFPALPIVYLPLRQSMDAPAVRALLRDRLPEIERALTTTPSAARSSPAGASIPFIDEASARPALETFERLVEARLTDGLPVIPPTRGLVQEMQDHFDREPEDVLIPALQPSGASLTVGWAAAVAVMAGCRPEYFPVVATALEAMADPRFALTQTSISSNPGGNLVLVSGPIAREVGIESGAGCMGPGFRANATIGRAINLAFMVLGPVIPGVSDLTVLGSPAEFSYCFAESLEESPWPPIHRELYDEATTTVTVHKAEGPHNVCEMIGGTPQGILDIVASTAVTLGSNNAYVPAELVVVLCPDHARIIAESGWSKGDVRSYLFEKARIDAAATEGRGQVAVRPRWCSGLDRYPAAPRPDDILVVVAGRHGPHSCVILPWGLNRTVTRPLALKSGRRAESIAEFRREARGGDG